jgi:hypothetical protein
MMMGGGAVMSGILLGRLIGGVILSSWMRGVGRVCRLVVVVAVVVGRKGAGGSTRRWS